MYTVTLTQLPVKSTVFKPRVMTEQKDVVQIYTMVVFNYGVFKPVRLQKVEDRILI